MTPLPLRRAKPATRLLLAATLLLSSTATLALEPFTATYRANYMGMQAEGTMVLKQAGDDRWDYSLEVAGMGARLSQRTTFQDTDGNWRPLSSTDSQAGESGLAAMLVKNRTVRTEYDWDAGQARWSGDVKPDSSGPVRLRPGDMDGMLINLAMVRDVAADKPLEYRLVEDGRARMQRFTVQGTEQITYNGQSRQATRVERQSGNRQTIAWIVDGLPVPARILQKRNGRDQIDLQLQSID